MTDLQKFLKRHITRKVKQIECDEIVYCVEDLGYLPFGIYHWINCGGEDISLDVSYKLFEFKSTDLQALEEIGFLEKVDYWQHDKYDTDSKTTYKVHLQV